jgi:hypothetical protein
MGPVILASTGVLVGCCLVIHRFYYRARNHIAQEMERTQQELLPMRFRNPVAHAHFPHMHDYGYPRGDYFRMEQ